jgi:hypothetical protein
MLARSVVYNVDEAQLPALLQASLEALEWRLHLT